MYVLWEFLNKCTQFWRLGFPTQANEIWNSFQHYLSLRGSTQVVIDSKRFAGVVITSLKNCYVVENRDDLAQQEVHGGIEDHTYSYNLKRQ
jgi:hypothetical protein